MRVSIVTPQSAGRRSGNSHTAARWSRYLRALGHEVIVTRQQARRNSALLIALHARKSAAAVFAFRQAKPAAPVVLVLTGTDVYRDIDTDADAQSVLELATRIVVLQPEARWRLTPRQRRKTEVIFQSAEPGLRHAPPADRFRVVVLGHLRGEKDPFRAVMALANLPDADTIELVHLGDALSPDMEEQAREWMKREPRYHWLGGRPHHQALQWLARSHLLVVSSVMEGGANVICEAARIGVPVLASRISGNVGMLGAGYPGYFPLFKTPVLASLIERACCDSVFYRRLKDAIRARRALFAPAAERAALRTLLLNLALRTNPRAAAGSRPT